MSSAAGGSSSDEWTSTEQPRLKVGTVAAKAIAQREQQQQQGHKSKKQRSCQQQRQQQNDLQDSEEEDQEDEAAGVEDQSGQDALGQLQQRLRRLQQQAQQQQQQQKQKQKQQQRSNQQQCQRHQGLPPECEVQDQEGQEPDEGDQQALGQLLQQLLELQQELQQQLQQQGQQQNMGAEGASDGRNYSQIRGRLVAAVAKYAAQLLPRGDIILLLILPLHKDGHLRTFHQGMTQDQLSAILEVLQNHETGSLGWMEARVQALLDMLGSGTCSNTQGQQQGKQQKRQLSQQQLFQVPYPKKTDEEEGGWDEGQDDSEAVSEGEEEAAGAAQRRGRKHSGGRNTSSSKGSKLRAAAAAEPGVDGQPRRKRQRAGAGKAASAAAAAAFNDGAARSPPKRRRLHRTDGWRQAQAAEAAEHDVALDDCDAAAATVAAPAAAAALPAQQLYGATTVPQLITALWAGVAEAEAVQPDADCTVAAICSAAFNAYEGAAAAGTLGKLQLRRVLREAYAWPLSSGTRERSWCDAAQETLSSYYEHRQGSMQGDKQQRQQQQQEQVRAGAPSHGGTVKGAAAGVHCANPAAAAALGPDAPTVAAAVAAAAPAAEEEIHSNTACIQQHVRALLAGEAAVQAVLPGSRCTVLRICNAAAAAYRAAEAEGTLGALRLNRALRTATGWPLQRNTQQRAWCDAAADALGTYYHSCKEQQQQRQEEVCAEGPGQRSGAVAAAAPGAAEQQSVHPAAAAAAGKAEPDQQRRRSGKQQQQQARQQQLLSLARAATAQRAHMPRKAAAGVSRATQAVLGNSQDLAAAAADKKAVAAAQRAALPASVRPPVTEAQRNMVQKLDTGALGIDIDGIVAALSGVPARIQAGDGSADVEADIAYAEKLAGTLEKPSTRSTVQAAIAKARTAVNATKF